MKVIILILLFFIPFMGHSQNAGLEGINPSDYLDNLKAEMETAWPDNRTINLVFHGIVYQPGTLKHLK